MGEKINQEKRKNKYKQGTNRKREVDITYHPEQSTHFPFPIHIIFFFNTHHSLTVHFRNIRVR